MKIPEYVKNAVKTIEKAGFEAFVVGGCVRDILRSQEPKDWDITTNARPEKLLEIFSDSKYENDFGTVLLPIKDSQEKLLDVLEITTYRSEIGYSNRRHPDEIKFEDSLDMDLSRRDFTMNALALRSVNSKIELTDNLLKFKKEFKKEYEIIDLFGGIKDVKLKIIRAVGEPIDRFKEDALRMMRAIRLSAQLDFTIEPKSERAISKMSGSIKFISSERKRDELIKILDSEHSYEGFLKLHKLNILQYIMPELEAGVGVKQNRHHIYTVFEHCMLSLKNCPSKDWRVKLASLLHDIGKPKTSKVINGITTFYNHEMLGAKMAKKIMSRLKFSNKDIEKVVTLIRYHMFYYNVDEVTDSSVRRLIAKVGKENLADLIELRVADRLGSGTPKAKPYKLRHLEYIMKKVQNDPVSVKMLKISGDDIIGLIDEKPGPKIGAILDVLLANVIEDSSLNTKDALSEMARSLSVLKLDDLREKAKNTIHKKRNDDDKKMKDEFWVK